MREGVPVTIILVVNVNDSDISQNVSNFKGGATVFLKEVPDPERFGVPVFDNSDKRIVRIDEKPKKPKSSYAVTGLYIYDSKVFDYIDKIKPSKRGQLEITDVNNLYLKSGELNSGVLRGFWSDAGTVESLYRTNVYWTRKKLGTKEKDLTTFDIN